MLIKAAIQSISLSLLALSSAAIYAETTDPASADSFITPTRSSSSISFTSSSALDKTSRDNKLINSDTDIMPALIKQGFRAESTAASTEQLNSQSSLAVVSAVQLSVTSASHDFSLFDASTDLISDFNGDGYYHRFSVTFDADTIYDVAYVYAKLYLSYEGGPWNHYATSDNFHIYLDSGNDAMTIETELADGFSPGYYDIRIELYDADFNDWLLSYGPYDDAALSNLPLEDSYYDDTNYYSDVQLSTELTISGHGHGAMSWLLVLIPALLTVVRARHCSKNLTKAAQIINRERIQ